MQLLQTQSSFCPTALLVKVSEFVKRARKLLADTSDQEDLAAVYNLIWEISEDDKSRKAAIRIFTKLNKAHPAYRYRLALKHLSL